MFDSAVGKMPPLGTHLSMLWVKPPEWYNDLLAVMPSASLLNSKVISIGDSSMAVEFIKKLTAQGITKDALFSAFSSDSPMQPLLTHILEENPDIFGSEEAPHRPTPMDATGENQQPTPACT